MRTTAALALAVVYLLAAIAYWTVIISLRVLVLFLAVFSPLAPVVCFAAIYALERLLEPPAVLDPTLDLREFYSEAS